MNITKIDGLPNGFYDVTFTPNFFEKIFGAKQQVWRFKEYGRHYVDENGELYGSLSRISSEIDKYKQKRFFNSGYIDQKNK